VNIALFGGTFDPIHAGHLRAAEAAARRFHLDRILFVPSGKPPHKVHDHLTSFAHRFGMVALACAGHPGFVPSLLEAPRADGRPHYSISTVRRVKRSLGRKDRLYFLIGVDAFLDLPEWKAFRRLLDLVNFIVVSRPGYSNREIGKVAPPEMLRQDSRRSEKDTLALRHSAIHILRGVDVPVASSDIRDALRSGRRVAGLVPPLVEEYMRKEGLYRPAQRAGQNR
jgi:nicotinate-nucleotide adenylyltransferase